MTRFPLRSTQATAEAALSNYIYSWFFIDSEWISTAELVSIESIAQASSENKKQKFNILLAVASQRDRVCVFHSRIRFGGKRNEMLQPFTRFSAQKIINNLWIDPTFFSFIFILAGHFLVVHQIFKASFAQRSSSNDRRSNKVLYFFYRKSWNIVVFHTIEWKTSVDRIARVRW